MPRTPDTVDSLRRERDAYASALHTMVNAMIHARQAVDNHRDGITADWDHVYGVLTGDIELVSDFHRTASQRANDARRRAPEERKAKAEEVARAVLGCIHTLQMLDALAKAPDHDVPFADKVHEALQRIEPLRPAMIEPLRPAMTELLFGPAPDYRLLPKEGY